MNLGSPKLATSVFTKKKQQCQQNMSGHEYGRSIGSEGQSGCDI